MKKIIVSLAMILLIAGCTSTGNLGMVARSVAEPGSLLTSSQPYKVIGPAKGKACRYFLLGIIPWGDSTLKTAVDKALAESGGDALINLSVSSSLMASFQSITCSVLPAHPSMALQLSLRLLEFQSEKYEPERVMAL